MGPMGPNMMGPNGPMMGPMGPMGPRGPGPWGPPPGPNNFSGPRGFWPNDQNVPSPEGLDPADDDFVSNAEPEDFDDRRSQSSQDGKDKPKFQHGEALIGYAYF